MLENIMNKKVRVEIAFRESLLGDYSYYKGTVVGYDQDFLMLDNNRIIGRKYILTIDVLE